METHGGRPTVMQTSGTLRPGGAILRQDKWIIVLLLLLANSQQKHADGTTHRFFQVALFTGISRSQKSVFVDNWIVRVDVLRWSLSDWKGVPTRF